jgi:ABC-type uncharacterized transport system involved in gliding motility auxiliary subunit
MKTRQTKYTAYVSVFILVVLAILGAVNWLAQRYNKSFDSTSNKRYSLSDQTEKVVKGLKNDLKITYFDRTSSFGQARDLLDRYNNLSTKLDVEYIDPDKKPQMAKAAGIERLGTIIVQNGPRREEAKSVSEEEVTSAIIRSLKEGKKEICFVKGFGELDAENTDQRTGASEAKGALEKENYQVTSLSLIEKPEIPKSCAAIIVPAPQTDYLPTAVDAIKKYMESGGRGLFMLDPPLKLRRTQTSDNAALVSLITSWGITPNRDLALDTSGVGQIFGMGPEMPLGTKYETHPIVTGMKGIATAFPLTRTLEAQSGKGAALVNTSSNSYATTRLDSPEISIDPGKDKHGPLTLAAAVQFGESGEGKVPARAVVFGGASWMSNNFLGFQGNRDLFLNTMNWLVSDEDLISIRPKDPQDRRITLNRNQMRFLFSASVIGIPLLIIGSGLMVWWKRR